MDPSYPRTTRTKAGSPVVIFGRINDMLYGAWCENPKENDTTSTWYPSRWDLEGRSHVHTETETALDLENV
jgi:hypothetical protein